MFSRCLLRFYNLFFIFFIGGFGEGHMSSDEEDMPDDADATDARKKARQGDDDFGEEMSDEEVDLAKVKYHTACI